jgi:hypothetical protein
MRHYTNPMDSLSQCRVSLQDAYQEIVDCKAKLAAAEAERSEARSLLLNGIQTNGDSLAFLEHVRREHAAVVAERDRFAKTIADAAYDAGEYDHLQEAEELLQQCVAKYSYEQVSKVGKRLRQWRDKWALILDTQWQVSKERDALNAKLAHAEAESAGYQKLAQACKDEDGKTVVVIIQGESEVRVFGPNSDCEERFGEVVVRWWKLLNTVVESKAFDALKAERDKLAESERAWCELATERGAKLEALVEAMERIKDIMGGHDGCQGFSSPEDVWGIADKALAAAKVQP